MFLFFVYLISRFQMVYFLHVRKKANVIPFFKKGDRHNIKNYRPVSLLSSISKIFEKAVHSHLYKYCELNYLLSDTLWL